VKRRVDGQSRSIEREEVHSRIQELLG
jgi:hypothetical protein